MELPTFIRSLGAIAGSAKVTLTEALNRMDSRSMGSLGPHIERLHTRLIPQLPTQECWEMFRRETGSELANRTTTMMVDAAQLGSQPDQVGRICSDYAMSITQLRAGRQLTASTFSFLAMAMHATMVFILVFVLEIVDTFNSMLSVVSSDIMNEATGGVEIPDNVELPPGVSVPAGGDFAGGLDIFGSQDMTITSYAIVGVIIVLTVANSLAPKVTAGGSNLKIASYLGIMCVISGIVLGAVPMLTAKLFAA
jgi:flagellar protein FlaJ